jgi:hypothetical protein
VNGRAGNFGWPTVVWSRVSTEAEDTIAEVLRLQKRNEITLGRLTTIISPIGSHAADVGRSGKWAAIELEVHPSWAVSDCSAQVASVMDAQLSGVGGSLTWEQKRDGR